VGEAEIDGVALVADVWIDALVFVDPKADAVHFFVAGGDDTEVAVVTGDEFGLATGFDEAAGGVEEVGVIFDEAFVGAAGLFVPGAEVGPAAEEAWAIDVAFADDEVVRFHEEAVLGEALDGLAEAAAGVDDPGGALGAELLDHLAEAGVEHGVGIWQDEGAIEIEAEEEGGLGLGHEGRCGQYAWNGCLRHEFFVRVGLRRGMNGLF